MFTRTAGAWTKDQVLLLGDGAPAEYGCITPTAFGWAVDLDGDQAVIGTPYGGGLTGEFANLHGSAYVFEKDPETGLFQQAQLLSHEDPVLSEKFGNTIAISGDWILVGSEGGVRKDNPGYVRGFQRDETGTWVMRQILEDSDSQQHDSFG
ncbi:TPA: hypothetical protein DCE37_21595 [Candidatus Latescibacteria bacterium]|nr:hypothetical protein [Candidatus Latescibacterota bacterium]